MSKQTQTKPRSSSSGLAFVVGALVVTVGVMGYFLLSDGSVSEGDDLSITIDGGGSAVEDASDAVEGAAEAVGDAVSGN